MGLKEDIEFARTWADQIRRDGLVSKSRESEVLERLAAVVESGLEKATKALTPSAGAASSDRPKNAKCVCQGAHVERVFRLDDKTLALDFHHDCEHPEGPFTLFFHGISKEAADQMAIAADKVLDVGEDGVCFEEVRLFGRRELIAAAAMIEATGGVKINRETTLSDVLSRHGDQLISAALGMCGSRQ